jgi:hypothetical protein
MTRSEFNDCIERLVVQFPLPHGDDNRMNQTYFEEWWATLQAKNYEYCQDAISQVIQTHKFRSWPTMADLMKAYASVCQNRRYDTDPETIHGGDWIEWNRRMDHEIFSLPEDDRKAFMRQVAAEITKQHAKALESTPQLEGFLTAYRCTLSSEILMAAEAKRRAREKMAARLKTKKQAEDSREPF